MSCRSPGQEDLPRVRADLLCKGWGDWQGPPCRTQETPRARLHGSRGGFLWRGREQQGQSEVKTLFSPRP